VDDGREADEDRGALAFFLKKFGSRVGGDRFGPDGAEGLEIAMGSGAAGVDDALGDALAVEVGDLFNELVVVLERRWTAIADGARVLVVRDRMALAGSQDWTLGLVDLVAAAIQSVWGTRVHRRSSHCGAPALWSEMLRV
jgi:hypothetical protein